MVILVIIGLSSSVQAQLGTFKGYVVAGTNIVQIEGDSVGGFNKWTLVGGLGTYFYFAQTFSANLELNYSQRGASGYVYDLITGDALYHRNINLNYLEVPFLINYHDKDIAKFGAGVAFSSLINTSQQYNHQDIDPNAAKVKDFYKSLVMDIVLSATFNIKKHLVSILDLCIL